MARQRLGIGEFGETSSVRDGKVWRARVRYRNQQGKVRQMGATGQTKRKAESALRRKVSATLTGHRSTALTVDNPTVSEVCRHWIGTRRVSEGREAGTISPSTLEQYEYAIERHVDPELGSLLVSEVSVARLETYLDSLIKSPDATSNALQTKNVLRQTFDMVVRYGYLEANPLTSVKAFPKAVASAPRAWTLGEVQLVRSAVSVWAERADGRRGPVNTWLSDLLDVMLGTSCRISEALALTPEKIHLDVDQPWVRIDRAVREPKRGPHTVGPTKSGDTRDLRIPGFLVTTLRRRLANASTPVGGPIFATSKENWIRPSAAHRAFRSALDRGQIDRASNTHLKPHGARKTAATLIARATSVEGAAAQLGHAGTATAERHYIEPDAREMVNHAHLLEALGPPTPG